ncbi:hypothetical protein QTA57_00130 [Fontisubflavum oceani]|uniref:hypothetical protein n=1 Tax=Fontisubflavum oceani TaxID=2978973 RepID=UPI0025B5644B|nr:hypothetical protein [Fontisubflavum oceani]WJY21662.1 hypothetical protein QTA57_00130 [Fontisubflavum oceani]
MTAAIVSFLAGFFLQGMSALACDFRVPLIDFENPTEYSADGSFVGAGIDAFHNQDSVDRDDGMWRGLPVIDIGSGRIGQRLERVFLCPFVRREYLLFTDCNSGEAIMVLGTLPPPELLGQFPDPELAELIRAIEYLQPPHGPIALSRVSEVSDVLALASAEDFRVVTDFDEFMAIWPRRSRFDPLHGCSIYYPELLEVEQ